jgi:hypothetical protein
MSKNQNSVTFIVGDNMLQENFKNSFEACYFIEQMSFELVRSTLNGVDQDFEKTMRFVLLVDAVAYSESISGELPSSFHELLGNIAWHQDMFDSEKLRKAEKEAYAKSLQTTQL